MASASRSPSEEGTGRAWLTVAGLPTVLVAAGSLGLPAGPEGDRWVLLAGAGASLVLVGVLLALRHRRLRVSITAILVICTLARLLAAAGPARFDDDLWRYLWDGMVLTEGVSPYRFAPDRVASFDPTWDPMLIDDAEELAELEQLVALAASEPAAETLAQINFPFYPTLYPPTSQLLFGALAAGAPGSDRGLRLALALADTLTVGVLLALLAALRKPRHWAFAYAFHPLPVLEFSAGGHQDALGVLLLLAAAWALVRARQGAGGALLALAVGVKLFPAGLLWIWRRALTTRGGISCLSVAAASCLPFALLGPADLSGLGAYTERWEYFSGPFALLAALTGPHLARGLVALAALVAGWWLSRRPASDPGREIERGFWWIEGLLVLSPVLNPWYAPWALAPSVLRGSLAWPLFAAVIPLAYLAPDAEGHPIWLRAIPWGLLLAGLLWEARGETGRDPSPGGIPGRFSQGA